MQQTSPHNSEQRSWPRRMLNRLEVDRAVFFAVTARAWQFVAGPVTWTLIVLYFSPLVQDFYYTFASLLALQSFVELGLHIVIINVASHEWSNLSLTAHGDISGDAQSLSRLVSLGRFIAKWYAIACVLFAVGVGAGGAVFFSLQAAQPEGWLTPWICFVLLAAILLWTLPFNALLEGCQQVATVNRFRVLQAVSASMVIWVSIVSGWNLWAMVGAMAARVVCDLWLLLVRYRRFFSPFLSPPAGEQIDWKREIWPLQWRIGIQGACSYFAFQLFTPVMIHYQPVGVAGQMGMSWAALTALQAAALSWVQTRTPRFGELIAQGDYAELDRIFGRLSRLSLIVQTAGSLAFVGVVWALQFAAPRYAERVLGLVPLSIFALGLIAMQIPECHGIYIRAHKRDTLLPASLISSVSIGLLVWLLGSRYGPTGAGLGFLGVTALVRLPYSTYLWKQCRRARQ